ncbi:hypothetical protein BSU04_06590 [Caballeronia sordidicola]|uniref:Uncharacterized protein n=1 Tax=Caballeronia sordidicola TaxID=196367 RepID=A0A226X8N3_CABSO|nr:hypothetical protein BSU04_06590 [Caballeronia sordidicola]
MSAARAICAYRGKVALIIALAFDRIESTRLTCPAHAKLGSAGCCE